MNTLRSENFHTWETIGRKAMQRESRRMERERGRVVKVGWDFEQKYLRWRLHQPINCSHCLQCIKWVSGPDWIPLRLLGLFEHLRCYQWKDKGASFYRNPTENQQFQKCDCKFSAKRSTMRLRCHWRSEYIPDLKWWSDWLVWCPTMWKGLKTQAINIIFSIQASNMKPGKRLNQSEPITINENKRLQDLSLPNRKLIWV